MAEPAYIDKQTAIDLIQFMRAVKASQILDPGYIERVVLKVMPRIRGDESAAYFWPPTGGIPAATTSTTTLTVGAAECYVATMTSLGVYEKGTAQLRVENIVPFVVGANGKPIKATRNEYGCYTVDVEDCS